MCMQTHAGARNAAGIDPDDAETISGETAGHAEASASSSHKPNARPIYCGTHPKGHDTVPEADTKGADTVPVAAKAIPKPKPVPAEATAHIETSGDGCLKQGDQTLGPEDNLVSVDDESEEEFMLAMSACTPKFAGGAAAY